MLPLIWWLLRVLPPRWRLVSFPAVRLLIGLDSEGRRTDGAPLWLRIMRLLMVALAIVGFANPLLDAKGEGETGKLLVLVMDGGWASAPDWELRQATALDLLLRAERAGTPAALAVLAATPPQGGYFEPRPASDVREMVAALAPSPWAPNRSAWVEWIARAQAAGGRIHWLTDGFDHGNGAAFSSQLEGGATEVYRPRHRPRALGPAIRIADGIQMSVLRPDAGTVETQRIEARDTEGRLLASEAVEFAAREKQADVTLALPGLVTNRVASFHIAGVAGAAAVRLVDDSWRQPRFGIYQAPAESTAQPLLQGEHFVRNAIAEVADTLVGDIGELIIAGVDGIVLVDRGEISTEDRARLLTWMEAGGVLVRFAGPRMASRTEANLDAASDSLLPVRLSPGDRRFGGALSWLRPQKIRPFANDSPFAGMPAPSDEIVVQRQLLATPDPALGEQTWARLEDGTPIVTAARRGNGEVVLFHTTASSDWTTLPLSVSFIEMLTRVVRRAGLQQGGDNSADGAWVLELAISGSGMLVVAAGDLLPVPATRLQQGQPAADAPPGIYVAGARQRSYAIDAGPAFVRSPLPVPTGARVQSVGVDEETEFGATLLALVLLLIAVDIVVAGILRGAHRRQGDFVAAALLAGLLLLPSVSTGFAQSAPPASLQTTFGYVATGDARIDAISRAGLQGLSNVLQARTNVEPAPPEPVLLGETDLALYPFVYWPVTEGQTTPSAEAYRSLNRFLASGGLLVMDTRDQGLGAAWRRDLPRLTAGLDLPAMAPVGPDHVLTKSYFLLQEFPGRWRGGQLWVAQGSGVSPLVVGNSAWTEAWAQDDAGRPLAALGKEASVRREMAYRAGINLVMYALTGNYKADQVHLQTILERLGQ